MKSKEEKCNEVKEEGAMKSKEEKGGVMKSKEEKAHAPFCCAQCPFS
jgi:hypothetical protein